MPSPTTSASAPEQVGEPSPASYPGVLLPLAEAAWAAGIPRQELLESIREGRIEARRFVRGGRVIAAVSLKDMERLFAERDERPSWDGDEVARMRERIARLEGELHAADKVETSLQRYADKLEERMSTRVADLETQLAEAHRREMTLARALGAAESRLERVTTRRVEPPKRRSFWRK